ncbi:MAG: hypothetical protein ACFB9N_09410 [Geitlerinemataceae cyanobacterium]
MEGNAVNFLFVKLLVLTFIFLPLHLMESSDEEASNAVLWAHYWCDRLASEQNERTSSLSDSSGSYERWRFVEPNAFSVDLLHKDFELHKRPHLESWTSTELGHQACRSQSVSLPIASAKSRKIAAPIRRAKATPTTSSVLEP